MTNAESAPILEINNIEVVYNHTVQVLRGLSLIVPQGRIVALLGSNGAGKSTTLKAASNLLALERGSVSAGTIAFRGRNIRGVPPHRLVRSGLFHVMEGRRIFPDLTVDDNLRTATYALEGRSTSAQSFDLAFTYFPILAERRRAIAGYLSGGEQQMLAISRALIAQPTLILMDEPSLGLSPILVEEIFGIIARINAERGVSILLVEQNAAIAMAVADDVYIMESGKIVMEGAPAAIAADRDVREFYLGLASEGAAHKSFRDVKHYKRRKRWLS